MLAGQRVLVLGGRCFLSVLQREQRKNVHTHVSVVQREGLCSVLFSTDGSHGGEEGCVCVCVCVCVGVGAAGVCSSSVCQQVNSPPFISDVGQMTGHTPLFTRSRSPYLSDYLFLLSLFHFLSLLLFLTCFKCLSRLLKPLFSFFFFNIESVVTRSTCSFAFFFFLPIFSRFKDGDLTAVNLPNCVSGWLSLVYKRRQKWSRLKRY